MKNFITAAAKAELQRLAKRYKKYGVSYDSLLKLVSEAPEGITEDMAVIGVRMALGEEYNEPEYFSLSDVCKVTGMTPTEVEAQMQELGITPLQVTSIIPGLFDKEKAVD